MAEAAAVSPRPAGGAAGAWIESAPPASPESIDGLRTYWIETWGCQMNEHDSEKMAGVLRGLGMSQAVEGERADVFLLNTCSVREKAAHKVFSRLGELRSYKRARPHAVLGVCGCVAQQEQETIFRRAPHVDLVLSPRRIGALAALIRESREKRRVMAVFDPRDTLVHDAAESLRVSRTRAYITIMEGCNKNCSFCIVPFTRGREVYRSPAAILREAHASADEGLSEIQLLGQNVNAWWHRGAESWDFTRLIGEVALIPGVRRLRFTTSHPLHFKDSIIEMMAARPAICRHLHLPVQSGSDTVLARMRRGYTREDYLGRIRRLRERLPDIALTTDIIVGFPGETEEDLRLTLDLVEEVGYDSLFAFMYSPRPGTPAESLQDGIADQEKKERLLRVQEVQERIQIERNRSWLGREVEVLVDGPAARGELLAGRTSQNHLVNFPGEPSLLGRLIPVSITSAGPHSLGGVLASPSPLLTSRTLRNIDR